MLVLFSALEERRAAAHLAAVAFSPGNALLVALRAELEAQGWGLALASVVVAGGPRDDG